MLIMSVMGVIIMSRQFFNTLVGMGSRLHDFDTQIYMSLSVSNAKESLRKLQHCLMGVSAWMTESKLKLNPSKTEFLLIGTKPRLLHGRYNGVWWPIWKMAVKPF